jgi:hypothetical protein
LRGLSAPAEEASPTCDQAGNDDALTFFQTVDAGSHFLDHADAFVAQHEAGDRGESAVIAVEVGAANAGARDSHERVGRCLERRVVDALDAHVMGSVENSSFHFDSSLRRSTAVAIWRDNDIDGGGFAEAAKPVIIPSPGTGRLL